LPNFIPIRLETTESLNFLGDGRSNNINKKNEDKVKSRAL